MPVAKTTKQCRRAGRPSKKTPQTVKALLRAIRTGAPYTICCAAVGIQFDTFLLWKRSDAVFAAQVEQTSAKAALRLLGKIEKHAGETFAAASWILERRFPSDFSRPEVQLNLIQQNNTTQNFLSISISGTEAKEIELVASPIRESVQKMYELYRPELGNGSKNGEPKPVVVEVVQKPIERKAGDEKLSQFWAQFVGDRDRAVEASTAVYVVRTIGSETVGAHRIGEVSFKGEVTVGEVLDRLEKMAPGSGVCWQLLQRKAGIRSQN